MTFDAKRESNLTERERLLIIITINSDRFEIVISSNRWWKIKVLDNIKDDIIDGALLIFGISMMYM